MAVGAHGRPLQLALDLAGPFFAVGSFLLIPKGFMCPNAMYHGLKVPAYGTIQAKVYTMWVHEPVNPKP